MPKVSPAPAQPVDMVPAERRQESQVLPRTSPIEAHPPASDRLGERRSIMQRLRFDDTPSSLQPQHSSPLATELTPTGRETLSTTTEERQSGSPLTSTPLPETAHQPDQKTPSLFTSLKNTFLNFVGLREPKPKSESNVGQPGDEKPGLFARIKDQFLNLKEVRTLSDLVSWGKGLACAAFPSLSHWFKPPQATIPNPLSSRPQRSTASTEPSFTHHHSPEILKPNDLISQSSPQKADLTAQALETVAEAKREQTAQAEKKNHIQQDLKDREKAKLRAALTKIATDGINKGDLSAIIAEFEGVYGSAEVAIRQVHELAAKKKLS